MKKIDFRLIQTSLLHFTKSELENFLTQNPDLIFHAFAYDCNAEYGEVNLCFLTEDEVKSAGEEIIGELGDWEFQGIATTKVFSHDERKEILAQMPDDNFASWLKFKDELMDHFTKTLIEFSKTEELNRIPKSSGFTFFCIDHSETLEDAERRLNKLNV